MIRRMSLSFIFASVPSPPAYHPAPGGARFRSGVTEVQATVASTAVGGGHNHPILKQHGVVVSASRPRVANVAAPRCVAFTTFRVVGAVAPPGDARTAVGGGHNHPIVKQHGVVVSASRPRVANVAAPRAVVTDVRQQYVPGPAISCQPHAADRTCACPAAGNGRRPAWGAGTRGADRQRAPDAACCGPSGASGAHNDNAAPECQGLGSGASRGAACASAAAVATRRNTVEAGGHEPWPPLEVHDGLRAGAGYQGASPVHGVPGGRINARAAPRVAPCRKATSSPGAKPGHS